MTERRIGYQEMQGLRVSNVGERLLRDDITADRYRADVLLAQVALQEAKDYGDYLGVKQFKMLKEEAMGCLRESPAYQSAACFLTAHMVEEIA